MVVNCSSFLKEKNEKIQTNYKAKLRDLFRNNDIYLYDADVGLDTNMELYFYKDFYGL